MRMLFIAAVIGSIGYIGYRESPDIAQWVDQTFQSSQPAITAAEDAADKVLDKANELRKAHPEVEELAHKVKDKVVEKVAEHSNEAVEALAEQVQNLQKENRALRKQLEQADQSAQKVANDVAGSDPYQSPYQPASDVSGGQQSNLVDLDDAEDVVANDRVANDNSARREQLLQLAERMELRALELMGE